MDANNNMTEPFIDFLKSMNSSDLLDFCVSILEEKKRKSISPAKNDQENPGEQNLSDRGAAPNLTGEYSSLWSKVTSLEGKCEEFKIIFEQQDKVLQKQKEVITMLQGKIKDLESKGETFGQEIRALKALPNPGKI